MIHFAIVGTNWITKKFIQAALETNEFCWRAVYSRTASSAQQFIADYGTNFPITIYHDLNELANDASIHAVYIASPNSLHYEQALLMIQHGKHVICEKPLTSTFSQTLHLFQQAEQHNVVLFEAFKTEFLPNFQKIHDCLPALGSIRKAHFSYCQYSSRYPLLQQGQLPNIFNPQYAAGSMMDIGFYCLSAAISLFGRPEAIHAYAHLLSTGVDGHGTVVLMYADKEVVLTHSKVSDNSALSEIQGEEGSLLIDHFSACKGFHITLRGGHQADIAEPQHENDMYYEALAFANQVNSGGIDSKVQERTLIVAELLTEIRRQTHVVFPVDHYN